MLEQVSTSRAIRSHGQKAALRFLNVMQYWLHYNGFNSVILVVANFMFVSNGSIVFFANSFAATAGTNTRNATFKIVHSDLLQ